MAHELAAQADWLLPPQQKGEQQLPKQGHWFDLLTEDDTVMRNHETGRPTQGWCDDPNCPHNQRQAARQQTEGGREP